MQEAGKGGQPQILQGNPAERNERRIDFSDATEVIHQHRASAGLGKEGPVFPFAMPLCLLRAEGFGHILDRERDTAILQQ